MALSKIPCGAVGLGGAYRGSCHFSVGILNTIEEVRSRSAKVTCFTVETGPPSRPPRNWQHYRGFDHLGRWGPQSGRPGHRPPGKIRHFRNDLRSFPGREGGSVWETHNTIEESTSWMAFGTVIYGISGDAVLRIRNTHGVSTSRPVAGPVIYGIFGGGSSTLSGKRRPASPK